MNTPTLNRKGQHDWYAFLTAMEIGDSKRLPLDLQPHVTARANHYGITVRTQKISEKECRVTRIDPAENVFSKAEALPAEKSLASRVKEASNQANYWKLLKTDAPDEYTRQKAGVAHAAWAMTRDRLSAQLAASEEPITADS